nr:TetR/AcrR family transcriptional regulator [Roseibium aestuarii]
MRCFWSKGYEATSMSDLVAATGMAKPGIYANFGDKEQLYQRALGHYVEELYHPIVEELATPGTSLRQDLRQALEKILHSIKGSGLPMGCFVLNSTFECREGAPAIGQRLQELNMERRDAFLRRLLRARDEGDLPASADPEPLANYFAGQSAALSVMAQSGLPLKDLEAMIEVSLTVLPAGSGETGNP